MQKIAASAATTLLFLATLTRAQQSPPTTQPTPINWPSLLSQLSSDKFPQREAAQKQLDQLTWRIPQLKSLAQTTPDPEAKSRLTARLQSLQEQVAVDPPPISLSLRDAGFPEMIHALETATGESFSNSATTGLIAPTQKFTLSATEKPFWEVFIDLSHQHGLQLHGPDGLRIFQATPGIRLPQIAGPLIAYDPTLLPATYFESQNIPGQPSGQVAALSINYTIALDPRFKVAKYLPPQLSEVVDDNGMLLKLPPLSPSPPWSVNRRDSLWTAGQMLPKPEKIGKSIASAKGRFIVTVQLAAETTTISSTDLKLNQSIKLAGQSVVISEFTLQDESLHFECTREYEPGASNQAAAPMSVSLLNSVAQPLWSSDLPLGPTSRIISTAGTRPPYQIQFTVTTKTKELTLPFELKNIPLPG